MLGHDDVRIMFRLLEYGLYVFVTQVLKYLAYQQNISRWQFAACSIYTVKRQLAVKEVFAQIVYQFRDYINGMVMLGQGIELFADVKVAATQVNNHRFLRQRGDERFKRMDIRCYLFTVMASRAGVEALVCLVSPVTFLVDFTE